MIGPPAKATSMRTDSGESGNGYDLRENAVNGVGMDKGNLQAEEAAPGDRVDQLGPRRRELGQRRGDVVDLVRDVVHAGTALREKPSHRRVVTGRGEQLDPARPNSTDAASTPWSAKSLAVLERPAEELGVGRYGLVEVGHGKTDVVDAPGCMPPMLLPGVHAPRWHASPPREGPREP